MKILVGIISYEVVNFAHDDTWQKKIFSHQHDLSNKKRHLTINRIYHKSSVLWKCDLLLVGYNFKTVTKEMQQEKHLPWPSAIWLAAFKASLAASKFRRLWCARPRRYQPFKLFGCSSVTFWQHSTTRSYFTGSNFNRHAGDKGK